ncbi:basic proline-rich protein-like [Choloepus didactylus]|uniref:basic proline-rich protein-like n=1 Tax=Choloepus didactylus TaxID=27675 RepID=UPI00189CE5B2|nr:basic proline-rich protein-like [Choloepus didactylus]
MATTCLRSPGPRRPVERRPPLRLGLQQRPALAGSLLGKHPGAGGTAPGQARAPRPAGHNDRPAHTQIHTRRPLRTNRRARAHGSALPEPRGQRRDPRRAQPAPADAPTATGARPPTHSPRRPQTRKHAPRARPAQPPPPPPRRPHLAALRAPLGAAPCPPRPCLGPGPLRRDGPGRRTLRAASSRGHPGPGEGDERESPRSAPGPRPCPLSGPPPSRAPPHQRLRPLRRSLARVGGAPPLLRRPRPFPRHL